VLVCLLRDIYISPTPTDFSSQVVLGRAVFQSDTAWGSVHINSPTPCSRDLVQKVVKKHPTFYETRRIITVSTKACQFESNLTFRHYRYSVKICYKDTLRGGGDGEEIRKKRRSRRIRAKCRRGVKVQENEKPSEKRRGEKIKMCVRACVRLS